MNDANNGTVNSTVKNTAESKIKRAIARLSLFKRYFFSSWLTFFVLMGLSLSFKIYIYFPAFGFIGYAAVIVLLLLGLSEATKQVHYIAVSGSLIILGAVALFDIILSRDELVSVWIEQQFVPLSEYHIEAYVNAIIMLLNIFTGSLAAGCLFHGLNKKNFK